MMFDDLDDYDAQLKRADDSQAPPEACYEATQELARLRCEAQANAIRHGFGHKAQVAALRLKKARRHDPQESLFDPNPQRRLL